MRTRGADLVVRALEDGGARFTFGIPGTHNIELYDALARSPRVTPVLVTDDQSASFMADGVSRTSGTIGVVNVVPGAGDGARLMTGLELLTAAALRLPPLVCVLRDEELGQIAQFQRTSLNRDTCCVLAPYRLDAFAAAAHADFLRAAVDADLPDIFERALHATRKGQPVVVEVAIDYSQKTYFTRGVVATTLRRLPLGDRLRMLARAATRHVAGVLTGRSRAR